MALVQDPDTGEWYDDGSDDYFSGDQFMQSPLFAGTQNAYLGGGTGGPLMAADYNRYGMEPYEQADINQQLTGMKNWAALLMNPNVGYINNVLNDAPTFDYEALMPGGGIYGQDMSRGGYGAPTMGGYGGAMAGGGGGGLGAMGGGMGMGGGGGLLASAMSSDDDVIRGIAESVASGVDPYTIQSNLAANNDITDQGQLDNYGYAARAMWDEALQGGGAGGAGAAGAQWGGKLTPLAAAMGKSGTPNPLSEYSADFLPAESEEALMGNRFLGEQAEGLTDMDRQIKRLTRRAEYGDVGGGGGGGLLGIGDALQNRVGRGGVRGAVREQTGPESPWGTYQLPLSQGGGAAAPRRAAGSGGGGLFGLGDALRTGIADRRAQQDEELPYTIQQRGIEMNGVVPRVTNKKRRTNRAGMDLQRAKKMRASAAKQTNRANQELRTFEAAQLRNQGRSPRKDALVAQMNFLRNAGIGV